MAGRITGSDLGFSIRSDCWFWSRAAIHWRRGEFEGRGGVRDYKSVFSLHVKNNLWRIFPSAQTLTKPNPNKNPETRPEGGVIPLKGRDKKESKPDSRNKGKPNWSNEGGKKSNPKNRARPKPDGDKQNAQKENLKKKKIDRPRKEKTNAPRGKNAVLKRRK